MFKLLREIRDLLKEIRDMMKVKSNPIVIKGELEPFKYSDDFERIWKLYGFNLGSKERAYKIFKEKWINTDIKLIENGINVYLKKLEKAGTLDFKRNFENFLHQDLERYIDKKI